MASFKQYTASGGASEAFSIPTFSSDEIKVYVDNVLKTATTHYNITSYTVNGGTVTWTSGNVPNGVVVRIVRDTGVTTARATYSAGSSIKAGDLNDNQTQALRSLEEQDDQLIQTYDVQDAAITTAKIKADNITSALIADDQINSEHYVDGSIDTAHIADAQVTHVKLANDCIDGDNIQNDVVNSEHYVAGSIDTEHIADSQVTTAKIAADAVTNAKIADNSIDSEHYVDGSIDTAHLADNSVTGAKLAAGTIGTSDLADSGVTTAKIAADAVTGAKIADDAIDSEHLAADSIDAEHYAPGSVDTTALGADSVTAAKIADDVINTEHYAPGSINNAAIGNNAVNSDQIADNAITAAELSTNCIAEANLQDNCVTTAQMSANSVASVNIIDETIATGDIADNAITSAKIAANAVTTSEIADAELTTLAGMQTGTASILAGGTALTATLAEINTVVDGKSVETTISDTDAAYPTSGAVVDYVAAQIAPIGGLEVIATDAAFPNTQPAAGVVISIADAGGLVVNGSGTSTTGRTVGGSTVTINNIASNFNSTTVDAGVAFMVSSTGSGQIYNYHKATLKEADLLSLSGDINDFAERYRVAGSAPSSSLDDGDLWWDTATDKLKVYDGSSWEEVASSGDFYINTISSYSGTGGNSASFNGSAYRFVLSNPGSTAQQHVVSINGVIQKPNSGTSQPSEGFVIDGSSIILSNAPASGADYFILTLGTTVSIGTPSDNTVSTAKIQNLAVTGDKIATNLDLADNKKVRFGTSNDLEIFHDGSNSYVDNTGTGKLYIRSDNGIDLMSETHPSQNYVVCTDGGSVGLYWNGAKKFETGTNGVIVTGNLDLNGDLDVSGGVTLTGDVLFDNATNAGNDITWDMSDNLLEFTDDTGVSFGDGKDLQIYHDGSNSIIKNSTGNLRIQDDDGNIQVQAKAGEESIIAKTDNAVELYYDNSKKFETTSSGVSVSGTITGAGHFYPSANNSYSLGSSSYQFYQLHLGSHAYLDDNAKLLCGNSDDLQIYHNGSHGYITEGTGNLKISAASGPVQILKGSSEDLAKFTPDGSCELYYDNVKKFETTSDGVTVTGTGYVSGGWRPLTDNALSLGSSAYRWYDLNISNDINISDNGKVLLGDGDDLRLWHDGTNSYITNSTGHINIQGKLTENSIICNPDGAVELYYDNSKKFATTSGGVHIYNALSTSGSISIGNEADLTFEDNGKVICGYGSDMQLFHDGSNNYVYGSTPIYVQSNTVELQSQGGDKYVTCTNDGSVNLYYNNVMTAATSSGGWDIVGWCRPGTDDYYDIGHPSYRWDDIRATNSTIQTSDKNEKNTIVDSDLGLSFVNKLKPVSYKFNDKTRTHYGLIAQDVETVITDLGKTTTQFAPLIKDTLEDGTERYGLRYTELISPLIKAVQELSAEVETLKTKVAALEAK